MDDEREGREAPPAYGDTADGDTADGDTADGDTADGDTADGDTADGDTADRDAGEDAGEAATMVADELPPVPPDESGAEPDAEVPAEADADEAPGREGPGAALSDAELLRAVSALVFASPEPLSTARLVQLLERPPKARVTAALEALGERLAASGLALELRSLAGGWQILSAADAGEVVARLFKDRKVERVTPAALETLAIVAYRQPVTKADVEAIRGVQAGPVLRNLVDRGLVKVTGRADVPGHPLLYGTTKQFLDRFGLAGLDELPRDGELARE